MAKCRELQQGADEPTRAALQKTLADLEARWALLNTQTGERHRQAQATLESLEVFEEKAEALQLILDRTESQLLTGDVQKMPSGELAKQLETSEVSCVGLG